MRKETRADRAVRKERQKGELKELMKARESRVSKLKKKERKLTWREEIGFWRIVWIFFVGLVCGATWTYTAICAPELYETRKVIIINNVEAKEITVEEEKEIEAEVEEVKEVDNVDELSEMIYKLESTSGKNNYSKCEEIGKVNGIGYGIPGNGTYQCFDSHKDEMQVLKGWIIDKKARGFTDTELLCRYSGNNYQICK